MSRGEPTSASRDAAIEAEGQEHPGALLLEARLDAQRRVLQWLLLNTVTDRGKYEDLIAALDVPWPPADFQEDPGAVNSHAYGLMAAYSREMRMLLRPLKDAMPI